MLHSTLPAVLVSDDDDVINNDVIHNEDEPRHDLVSTNQPQLSTSHDESLSADALYSHPPQPNSVSPPLTPSMPPSGSQQNHEECEPLPVEEEVKVQLKEEGSNEEPGLVTGNHLERQQVMKVVC